MLKGYKAIKNRNFWAEIIKREARDFLGSGESRGQGQGKAKGKNKYFYAGYHVIGLFWNITLLLDGTW